MGAWVYQIKKQVEKRGAEAASFYVGWYDEHGRQRCKSFGPGSEGKRTAQLWQEAMDASGPGLGQNQLLETGIPPRRGRVGLRRSEAKGFVYFVEAVGLKRVKIGTTTDLSWRISQLRIGCPVPLKLLAAVHGDRSWERAIHAEFAWCRLNGEWFALTPELDARILGFGSPLWDGARVECCQSP